MVDIGSGFSSGAQGAMAGSAIAPGIGTAIGGGIGFLAGLFSDSPSDIARKRWEAFKKRLQEYKTEGIRTIGEQTAAGVASATAGGRRRAIASGRDYQAESFILPGVGQAQTTGAGAMKNFLSDVGRMEVNAAAGEMNLPAPEQAGEYFDVAAGGVGKYMQNKKMYDLLEKAFSEGQGGGGEKISNPGLRSPSDFYKW